MITDVWLADCHLIAVAESSSLSYILECPSLICILPYSLNEPYINTLNSYANKWGDILRSLPKLFELVQEPIGSWFGLIYTRTYIVFFSFFVFQ